MINTGSYLTFIREVPIVGYVLDEPSLRRINEYARASLSNDSAEDLPIKFDCVASMKDSTSLHFNSLEDLLGHFSRAKDLIKDLGLDYQAHNSSRINVSFQNDGKIRFTVYGPGPTFEFMAEGLTRELKNCDPHYSWLAQLLAFSKKPRILLSGFIMILSFYLLSDVFFYIYASRIGINVDPSLLYEGNAYYEDVERAIKSNSTEEKLNLLLKGQLKGFTNVSVVLENTQARIGRAAIGLIFLAALLFALRSYSSTYLRAFFALGLATEQLRHLERKREFWVSVVVIGFIVNVAAGLFIAFLF